MSLRKYAAIAALASVPLMMTLGNSMLIPILPELSRELGVKAFQISLIITVYSVVAILLIPIAGYLSDRFGRKKVMIPALMLAAAGGLLSAIASSVGDGSYMLVLVGRFVQGAGAAGAFPIVFPLTGDLFKEEEEASSVLGLVETSNTFGKVLSPILGSLIALWAWYMPFYAIPVLSIISAAMILFLIHTPEQKSGDEQEKPKFSAFWRQVKTIFKNEGKWLSGVFISGGAGMFAIFTTLFYLSERLESQYGYKGVMKGALLAIPLSALCLASFLTGKWIGEKKNLMKWLSVGGMALLSATSVLCAINPPATLTMWFVWIGIGSIGIGVMLPCMDALITEGIEKEQRGTVTSLYSSMRFIGVAAGPPLAALLMGNGASPVFWTVAGVSIFTVLSILWLIKPESKAKSKGGIDRFEPKRNAHAPTKIT
ncbi:MFS transporter [Paenibacillus methanolicus]|uniref:ACDE family multidrug resistance protein n=1 Tax=Paenibacillus methanolicus TaxID=582686 RepID=A0A5S5CJ38_9BACL|nr:MFS transporter [Paenibacillus methanolicus]TYP79760.1 ACDE family multidrug resistance protein [Paenibacillus methanolicus]